MAVIISNRQTSHLGFLFAGERKNERGRGGRAEGEKATNDPVSPAAPVSPLYPPSRAFIYIAYFVEVLSAPCHSVSGFITPGIFIERP